MNVLFFAFANSPIPGQFLPKLQEEEGFINTALSKGEQEQKYLLKIESFANLNTISQALQQYQDNLTWFHYSGHAEKHQLVLKDQTVDGKGIIHMLKQCPKLKGVVLNGCSTKWQAAQLRAAGISVVIGTSSPVGDDAATNFSGGFYNMLSMGKTVSKAFETAIGAAMASGISEITRGGMPPGDLEEVPLWGILTKNEDAKELKIPFGGEALEDLKERLRTLATTSLEEAIDELRKAIKKGGKEGDSYILLESRFNRNNHPNHIAVTLPDDIRRENNRILQSLLSIIKDLKEENLAQ